MEFLGDGAPKDELVQGIIGLGDKLNVSAKGHFVDHAHPYAVDVAQWKIVNVLRRASGQDIHGHFDDIGGAPGHAHKTALLLKRANLKQHAPCPGLHRKQSGQPFEKVKLVSLPHLAGRH